MRGLRTKLHTLRYNVPLFNIDYFVFTETWLSSDITDNELGFDNYNIFRVDRSDKTSNCSRGGGVMICVHKRYDSMKIKVPINSIEQLFVMIKYGNHHKFILGSCYIPPISKLETYTALT